MERASELVWEQCNEREGEREREREKSECAIACGKSIKGGGRRAVIPGYVTESGERGGENKGPTHGREL